MKKSTSAYRINIKRPVYAEVTSDTGEGTSYGEVKSLGEAQQAQITASVASGQLHGDGAIVDSSAIMTGLSLVLSTTKVPIEAQVDIYNYKVTDGVVQVKAGVKPKYIAVGYEVEQTDGSSEFVWLLKGRPQPLNSDVKQSEGNINYSTDSITIDFVRRKSDNMLKFFADGSNPELTKAQADAWFDEGPSKPVSANKEVMDENNQSETDRPNTDTTE